MVKEISMRVDPLFLEKFERGRRETAKRLNLKKLSQSKFSKLLAKSNTIDLENIKLFQNEKTISKKRKSS